MAFPYSNPVTYSPNYFVPNMVPQMQQPMPVQAQQQAPQNSSNGLIWVQGESGAKSYLVAPNNTVLLMDSESPKFFIKSADNSGMPQPLRVFEYKELTQKTQKEEIIDSNKYVTREEFDKRIAEITEKKSSKKEVKSDE